MQRMKLSSQSRGRLLRGALAAVTAASFGLSAAPAPAVGTDPDSEPITFGTPSKMPLSQVHATFGGASEPSIALDSLGTIFVTAACCVPTPAGAWYSKDGGQTFQHLPSPAGYRENTIGAEGDYVVDEADRVILADTRAAPTIVVTRWRDRGDTWERSVDASEVTVPLQDRPWLGWGKGSLYLYTNGGIQNTQVFQSYDEGLTWNPIPIGSFSGNFPTTFTANRQDGGLWLIGTNGIGTGTQLVADVSPDGGQTWRHSNVAVPARGTVSPVFGTSIATDEAGNGYAVWSTYDGTGCDVYLAVSTDHGQSWGPATRVNVGEGCATFPWVDAGDPGRAVVVWYHSDTKKAQNSMPTSATWHVQAAVSTDALSDAPSFTEARLPNVVVDRGSLNRDVLDFFEVAVGPDGRFHIAYAENTSQTGRDNVWYVRQASGPLLHADRNAAASSASVTSASVAGGTLTVTGGASFKKPAPSVLFPGPEVGTAATRVGGSVERVGPDSDELLLTISAPPNGTLGFDGLPGTGYTWDFSLNGVDHQLAVDSRTATGPAFRLDGKAVGGTIDGFAGRAIARVPLSAFGASPGSAIAFKTPRPVPVQVLGSSSTVSWTVPVATVSLSLRQGGLEVAAGTGALSEATTTFTGSLDVSSLSPGVYELVATACYAGDCASTTATITV